MCRTTTITYRTPSPSFDFVTHPELSGEKRATWPFQATGNALTCAPQKMFDKNGQDASPSIVARILDLGVTILHMPAPLKIAAIALALLYLGATSMRTVTVTEGTNVNVTISPDRKTIIMDLQETLWSLPITGGQ